MGKWSTALSEVNATTRPPETLPQRLPASFWRRASAWSLDLIPFQLLGVLILWVSAPSVNTINDVGLWLGHASVVFMLLWLLYSAYHILMEHEFQTTVGKWLVGCSVSYAHSSPSWMMVVARYGACMLSWALLNAGHAFIVWRRDRKALHDIITVTQVVIDPQVELRGHGALETTWQKTFIAIGIVFQLVIGVVLIGMCVSVMLKIMQTMVFVP